MIDKFELIKFGTQSLYIILLSLIFSSIDLSFFTNKCIENLKQPSKIRTTAFIMFHHLLATIANFAWLSTSKIILVIFILLSLIIFIHWLINKNKCTVTEKINKVCGFPNDRLFPDFFYIIGFKKFKIWNNYGSYIYVVLAVIISIYKLITL